MARRKSQQASEDGVLGCLIGLLAVIVAVVLAIIGVPGWYAVGAAVALFLALASAGVRRRS